MIETLKQMDIEAFLWLNGWHSAFWDAVMYAITYRLTWFPFYGLLIYWLARRYRWKAVWRVLALILIIVLADQTASGMFKPYFARLRPCHEPALQALVHTVGGCGGSYGFVSSHAANTFGLATALWLLLRREVKWARYVFVWAALVTYSRIYVGVHYPLDLIGGGLVGAFYAFTVLYGFQWVSNQSAGWRASNKPAP